MTTFGRIMFALLLSGLGAFSSMSYAAPSGLTLNTSVSCVGGGTDCGDVSPITATCKRNCIITVTASPWDGWRFDHWGGGASGSANPTSVRVTSDTTATAFFVRLVPPPPPPPPAVGHEVIGYFIQWGIYGRNYLVKDVVATGAAKTLTVINYAFAGIADNLTCTSLDTFADWGKSFSADESVDGVGDTVGQSLKGNFNQLKKLKARYPQIRVVISIGGWSDSGRFSDAALPANRAKFVKSCVDMFIKGQFAAGVSGPGVFDGIDIDWEYPGACGATCNFRPDDKANFTSLLQEFRTQLDTVSPGRLLTAATPVAAAYNGTIDLLAISAPIDWMNLMSYDFHGSWEPNGPTNHHANIYTNANDPSLPKFSVDAAVSGYIDNKVPASKIAIGLPFYGHGWTRVPAGEGEFHGLYQSAGGLPRGTWERGIDDYKVLKTKGYPEYWDPIANASWLYNGGTFWSFDSPRAVRNKMRYVAARVLRGVMLWELSGDDGTLVGTIADCLGPDAIEKCLP